MSAERSSRAAKRWFLAFGAAFVLLAAGSTAYLLLVAIPESRAEALADWETRLTAMADDREAGLERWVRDFRSDAQALAQYPTAVYVLSGRSGPPYPFDPDLGATNHLQELLAGFVGVHDYSGAALFDSTGSEVVRTDVSSGPPELRAAWVRAVLEEGGSQVRFAADGAGTVFAISPIRNLQGEVLGAALVEAKAGTFLYPLLTQQPVPSRTGETLLLTSRDGTPVYLSPLRKGGPSAEPGSPADGAALAAAGGEEGSGRHTDYRGDDVLTASRTIAGTEWALLAKVDREEALSDYREALHGIVGAILGLLLGALGIGFGLWRWQRYRLAAALLRERARFAALLDNANDPIFFLDATGRIVDANRRAEEFYGRSRAELLGRSGETLQAGDDPGLLRRHLAEGIERGKAVVEAEHRLADGSPVPVELSTRSVELEGQQLLIAIVRDIRERRKTEEELRKAEIRYRTLVENSPDLIARFGPDLRCRFVSPWKDGESPFPVADVVDRRPRELGLPDTVAAGLERALQAVFSTGEIQDLEVTVPTGGPDRTFDWRFAPERDEEGAVSSAVAIIRETTKEQALAQQLRHAQKMEAVGRLAGGVAHDFNNIITSIQGHATLALEELGGDASLQGDLEEILRSASRAAALTNQLLAFSRRQILQPSVVNVAEVVNGLQAMMRRLIGEHIQLDVAVAEDEPHTVLADPSQLEQVVLNLAVNARDAMPDGGTLRIRVDHVPWEAEPGTGRAVRLRVEDTGAGIAPDVLDRIFEPFFTTKDPDRGTGLGLSTVYGIVEQSSGRVAVESEPGRGARFDILLPGVDAEATAGPAEPEAMPAASRTGATVLLVEDEDGVRRLAHRVLERQGYRVLEARTGSDALRLASGLDEAPDLLLTDMVMPGMDGRELARRLRSTFPTCRVLLMSGYTEDMMVRERKLDGQTFFMEKPFTPAELIDRVAATLRGRDDE